MTFDTDIEEALLVLQSGGLILWVSGKTLLMVSPILI